MSSPVAKLAAHLHPEQRAKDGVPVRTEPYLGAGGHLDATFPTAGRYRLFLQFRHAGRVHTAAFTQEIG